MGEKNTRRCDGCAYWTPLLGVQNGRKDGACHNGRSPRDTVLRDKRSPRVRQDSWWCSEFWPATVPLPRPWRQAELNVQPMPPLRTVPPANDTVVTCPDCQGPVDLVCLRCYNRGSDSMCPSQTPQQAAFDAQAYPDGFYDGDPDGYPG